LLYSCCFAVLDVSIVDAGGYWLAYSTFDARALHFLL
jgi:hypothetical protein